jgi:iron complex outermembrane receptor protein
MEVLGNTASGMDNRGGVSRTRAFDYSLFASELFNRVTCRSRTPPSRTKAASAAPCSCDRQAVRLSGLQGRAVGQGSAQQQRHDKITPRVVGLISNRWGDFGALASVAYGENDSNEFGYRSFNWGRSAATPATSARASAPPTPPS